MVIAYYTDQLYLHGGIEKILSQKLNYLAELPDYEIHLITTEQKGKPFCYSVSKKVKHTDLVINYVRSKSYFSFKNLSKVPKHIVILKANLKKIKPDVLIVCNYATDFYFIPFISNGIKTIKEFHSSRYYYEKKYNESSKFKKLNLNLNKWIEKKYSTLVVLNEYERKYYYSENVEIIPNFCTSNTISEKPIRRNIIIAAGRIAPVKQFDHLIKSWSLIANKYPEWEVHIYGEGDLMQMEELKKLIIDLKLPNVYLKGATNNLEIKMQEASIFAMTSETECFPMVLLEALSCGLSILSYDCPYGPKSIITNGEDGLLVEKNNMDVFANVLSKLIKTQSLRDKIEKNAIYKVQQFDEKLVMKQWLNLFNKI